MSEWPHPGPGPVSDADFSPELRESLIRRSRSQVPVLCSCRRSVARNIRPAPTGYSKDTRERGRGLGHSQIRETIEALSLGVGDSKVMIILLALVSLHVSPGTCLYPEPGHVSPLHCVGGGVGGHSSLPFCLPVLYSPLLPPTGHIWQPVVYVLPEISGPVILDIINSAVTLSVKLSVYWQDFRLIIRYSEIRGGLVLFIIFIENAEMAKSMCQCSNKFSNVMILFDCFSLIRSDNMIICHKINFLHSVNFDKGFELCSRLNIILL